MKNKLFLSLLLTSSLLAVSANGASVVVTPYTGTSDWPSADFDAETLNAFANTPGSVNAAANRFLGQGFTLTEEITIGSIYLTVTNYDPAQTYTFGFYSIANPSSTTASNWTGASLVTGTSTFSSADFTDGPDAAVTGQYVVRIDLDPSEAVTLAAGTYFFGVQVGESSSFQWTHSNTGTNLYTDGGMYYTGISYTSGSNANQRRDFGLAFAPVPEPSVALLGGLSLLGLLRRRRVA
ncbi:MAG: hypothetical protein QM627_13615 [Luteolibacter sp.]